MTLCVFISLQDINKMATVKHVVVDSGAFIRNAPIKVQDRAITTMKTPSYMFFVGTVIYVTKSHVVNGLSPYTVKGHKMLDKTLS